MESTSQTNNHGCFWYLFCCCLCDSGEDTTQQRVATATDPLLKHGDTPGHVSIAPRQVTFDSSRSSPPKGILKRVASDHSINGRGIEQMPVHVEPVSNGLAEAKTPPRSPGSDRSFGSNPNSPVHGYTATVDYSQWGVVKGTSSPKKDGEKV
ncbi:MAG: hypothetical protein KFB95_05870 [Simkaniaceae bacterium]|nr:MAG: hypothetical protein KFB95_05870 [Simkaniaceae bacterium]